MSTFNLSNHLASAENFVVVFCLSGEVVALSVVHGIVNSYIKYFSVSAFGTIQTVEFDLFSVD